MRLYHQTDRSSAESIMTIGFSGSAIGDSVGHNWLSSSISDTQLGVGRGWVVVVELPTEEAERYRHYFDDGRPYFSNYKVPVEVLNAHRPFAMCRIEDVVQ